MKPEDDERSIYWAPEKIKELRAAVFSEAGDNRITTAHQRVTEIAGLFHKLKQMIDPEKVQAMDRRTQKDFNAVGVKLQGLQKDLDGTDKAVNHLNSRVSSLEELVMEILKVQVETSSETVKAEWRRAIRDLDSTEMPPEFSAPIGTSSEVGAPEVIAWNPVPKFVDDPNIPPNQGVMGDFMKLDPSVSPIAENPFGWHGSHRRLNLIDDDEAEARVIAALDKIDLYGRHRAEILSALRGERADQCRRCGSPNHFTRHCLEEPQHGLDLGADPSAP